MVTVDSEGRIVLPRDVREQIGLDPGTEVDVRLEDGRIIIESEEDPEAIVRDLEVMIQNAASHREQSPYSNLDPVTKDHVEVIRNAATR